MQENVLLDIQQKAFLNLPFAFDSICLVYPLTIKDIISMGNINYSSALTIMTLDEYDIIENLKRKNIAVKIEQIDIFDYLLTSADRDYNFLLELKKAFRTFIREEITVLYDEKIIVVGDAVDKRLLNKQDFEKLQNIVRIQNKRQVKVEPPKNETPLQKRFRQKREYRDYIKRTQKSKGNGEENADFTTLLSSLCCLMNKSPKEIQDYSFYAFKELFERYQLKNKYDLDLQSILAGADPKKVKPKSWIQKTE